MLIAFCGPLGCGKTLGLVWWGYQCFKAGMTLYSNFHIKFEYESITCLEDIENMREGCVLLDELWLWADARMSAMKRNRMIAGILLKSRKRKIKIGCTAQAFRQLDIRMRHITDYIVRPEMLRRNKWCILQFFNNPPDRPIFTRRFRTEPFFKMYDTAEEIYDLEND